MAKISIVLPDLRGGGAERVNLDLALEFAKKGHSVEFVLLKARGDFLAEAQAHFAVYELECDRIRQVPFKLSRYLREEKPDAMLAAMWPLTAVVGLAVRFASYSGRTVASEHVDFRITPSHTNWEKRALKHLGRWFYDPYDSVVAVSSGVRDSLQDRAGLIANKVEVIHNPLRNLSAEELSTDDCMAVSGWLQGQKRLIAMGTLKRQKGFDVLFRALHELKSSVDAHLLILGDGPLRNELEKLASELQIEDRVCLLGFRSNPGAFLKHADVFVLSSNWEGFGNVVVEALSEGVPVVSTDCPSGPAEILEDGRHGKLVSIGDWRAMSRAIEEAFGERPNPDELKIRAADFRPEIAALGYLQLLIGK